MKKNKIIATTLASALGVSLAFSTVANLLPNIELAEAAAATYSRAAGYTYEIDEDLKGSPDTFEAWIFLNANSKGGTIMGNACNEYSRNGAYKYHTVNWEVTPNGYMRVEWDDTATQTETAYDPANDARGSRANLAHTFASGASLKDGKWHHVAVVRTNTDFKYYLDGTLTETYTVASTPAISTDQMVIGSDNSGWLTTGNAGKTPFDGAISQITVYEGAASAEQIAKDAYRPGGSTNYINRSITQADDISPNAELMGNWNLGSTWTQAVVPNTCLGGPSASLATTETFVPLDMPEANEYDYAFVAIPDIQYMTRQWPDRAKNAMNWLASVKDTYNIQFAMQLGDLADTGWVEWEYKNAYEAMNILTDAGIPWSFVPGNHDYNNSSLNYENAVVKEKGGRVTDYLDKWFPVNNTTVTGYYQGPYSSCDGGAGEPNGYQGAVAQNYTFSTPLSVKGHSTLPGFGGVYEADSMGNNYYLYDAKDRNGNVIAEYLVMNLEYQPRKSVLRWMNRIIDRYPERRVIITSHNIVCPDGNFLPGVGAVTDVTPSQIAFNQAYNVNENVFLTLSGHECTDDIIRRMDYGQNGNKITSMLIDHQDAKDQNETTAWNATNSTTGEATGASAVRYTGQDILAIFFVNEETKEIIVRDVSPENIQRGQNSAWNIQNQFTFSFADENNPAIGGVKTTVTGTVKNVVDGAVAGATVKVKGTSLSATTAANGSFSIAGVDAGKDATLIVTKDGYEESLTEVSASTLKGATTALGNVSINLPSMSSGTFASSGELLANNSVEVTRTLDGILFKLSGTRALKGLVEVYVTVGEKSTLTSVWDAANTSMIRFDFTGGGILNQTSLAFNNATAFNADGIASKMHYNDATQGYSGEFLVPYSWFSQYGLTMNPTDDFYIGLAQNMPYENTGSWTWVCNGTTVNAANPSTYAKVTAKNRFTTFTGDVETVLLQGTATVEDFGAASGVTVAAGGYSTKTSSTGSWYLEIPLETAQAGFNLTYDGTAVVSKATTVPANQFTSATTYTDNVVLEPRYVTLNVSPTNVANGDLSGATVSLGANQASVAAGKATFENVYAGQTYEISVAKEGFETASATFNPATYSISDLNAGTVAFNVDVPLAYQNLYTTNFGASDSSWVPTATRSASGLQVKLTSADAFASGELINVYIDTGNDIAMTRDATDYRFQISSTGAVTVTSGVNDTAVATATGVYATVSSAASGSEVVLYVPYSFYGGTAADAVGFAFTAKGVTEAVTRGGNNSELAGAYYSTSSYVREGIPADYIRMGLDGNVFWSLSNGRAAEESVQNWQFRFGEGIGYYVTADDVVVPTIDYAAGDVVHGNIKRENGKMIFEFVTRGDMTGLGAAGSQHAIRVCFDVVTGQAVHKAADAVIRMYLDGTVVYRAKSAWGADEDISWFNKSQGTTLATKATVKSYTSTDLKLNYLYYEFDLSQLGSTTATYGLHMRETYETAGGSGDTGYVHQNTTGSWVYWWYGDDSAYYRSYADGTFDWAKSNG